MATIYLLKNVDVDTEGTALSSDGGDRVLNFFADNYGGGAITIQISDDNGTHWSSVTLNGTTLSVTSNTAYYLYDTGQGQQIRAVLAGSTGASNVNCTVSS